MMLFKSLQCAEKKKLSAESNMIHKGRMLKLSTLILLNELILLRIYEYPADKKLEFNFPDLDSEETENAFMGKTWFDFLGLEPDFYSTIQEAKTSLERQGIEFRKCSK